VNAVRLLDQVQRRCGFDCSVRSLTKRCSDADLCDEGERKRAASRRQRAKFGHHLSSPYLSSLSMFFTTPLCVNASDSAYVQRPAILVARLQE
jgi:hypothetical protein